MAPNKVLMEQAGKLVVSFHANVAGGWYRKKMFMEAISAI